MNIIEYLNKQPKQLLTALGLLLVCLIGVIDYLTGSEIVFSIFYLIPVSLTTWFIGFRVGLFVSLMSAVVWLIADLLAARPFSSVFVLYWNAFVRFGSFLIVALLQNSLKNEQLHARVDSLTGIGNRRHFFRVANAELDRARRYNRPFTVAYLDIDNFKTVNDTFGHSAGDAFLKAVSDTIKSNIRSTDTAARLGGDEFALFLPETENKAAREFIQKLNKRLLYVMKEKQMTLTFSFGVVTFVSPPDSVDNMLKKVDGLMYSSKKSGKNKIQYGVS